MAIQNQDYMKQIEDFYMKLPPLPPRAREVLVQIAPWISLIFGVLGVLGALALFGVSIVATPFMAMGGIHQSGLYIVAAIVSLVSSVLLLIAFPGLNKRKMQGWKYLFWSELAGLVGAVISLSPIGVVFSLVWIYVLFQMKSYYK